MTDASLDQDRLQAFGAQMADTLNKAAAGLMLSVGHRTGLFDAMAAMPPSTSAEIAAAAGLQERYVREGLGALVTSRIVEHDAAAGTYRLPPEHAAFLTREAGGNNMACLAQLVPLLGAVEDQLVTCFRQGGGVPYSSYGRFPEVMRELSAPTFESLLVDRMLPLAEGLVDALREGIDVLEVGCGSGRAINVMAAAFPNSRFVGYDFIEAQIAHAQAEADARGLSNARFEVKDVAALDDRARYGFVAAFDAVHDQARPDVLLGKIAGVLKPGGTFLMWDVDASTHLHQNMDLLLAPLMYTVSCMHCMTVSLAQQGAGLGAMWGREKATEMLAAAGLEMQGIHRFDEDPMDCCYIATKR